MTAHELILVSDEYIRIQEQLNNFCTPHVISSTMVPTMGTCGLPVSYTLSPRACGPQASGVYIRQTTHAHGITSKCMYMIIYIGIKGAWPPLFSIYRCKIYMQFNLECNCVHYYVFSSDKSIFLLYWQIW